jgi:hypothetical protein
MIARVWRGWALAEGAAAYRRYFGETLGPELRAIPGFVRGQLLVGRPDSDGEVGLTTVTWFASMEAVRRFAGAAYDRAVVSDHARSLLTRFDETVAHLELVAEL